MHQEILIIFPQRVEVKVRMENGEESNNPHLEENHRNINTNSLSSDNLQVIESEPSPPIQVSEQMPSYQSQSRGEVGGDSSSCYFSDESSTSSVMHLLRRGAFFGNKRCVQLVNVMRREECKCNYTVIATDDLICTQSSILAILMSNVMDLIQVLTRSSTYSGKGIPDVCLIR